MAVGIRKQLSLRDFLVLATIAALGLAISMERARWRSEFDQRLQLETKYDRIPATTDILITDLARMHSPTNATVAVRGLIRLFPPERSRLTNTLVTFQIVEAKSGKTVAESKQSVILDGQIAAPLPSSNGSAYGGHLMDVTKANAGLHLVYVTLFNGDEEIAREIATIELLNHPAFAAAPIADSN